MKLKNLRNISMLLAATALSACSLIDDEVEGCLNDFDGLVPVEFSVSSDSSHITRASSSIVTFTANEKVRVCVKPSTASSYTGYDYTVASSAQTSNLTAPSTPPYFPPGSNTTVQAYAYYPSTASTTFSVNTDQTTDANYKASDLMYASDRTITKGSSAGTTFNMNHLMAQLAISVQPTDGLSITNVLVNAKYKVTFSPEANTTVSTQNDKTDIVVNKTSGLAYVLIPSQNISDIQIKVGVSGTSEMATYSFSSSSAFSSGSTYQVNLSIGRSALGANTTISGWTGQGSVSAVSTIDLSGCTLSNIPTYTYSGNANTPSPTIYLNGAALTANDYTLSYLNNVNAGTATVIVTGKGRYSGSKTQNFTINKATLTVREFGISLMR